ncbi:hypothetical protein GUJ93_ZPchr0001g29758 [Zizania palustris]|uniref:Uncharacterized protein n=1 Tax=Zizania palustris TaxID=103762 RepID=A0A8J5RP98_ZIZPA|nr:hypothetical protein GUJ93_ZPchr0001g29758 [Zizania palustris]
MQTSRVATRKHEPEQLSKNFELCGTPDELICPGVTKMSWYNNFKPQQPMKSRPRISVKDKLDAEYFWTDPLPYDPESLPKYEASHEFQTTKKRQQQRQAEEAASKSLFPFASKSNPEPRSTTPNQACPAYAQAQCTTCGGWPKSSLCKAPRTRGA